MTILTKFQLLLLAVALFAVLALVESRPARSTTIRQCWGDYDCVSSVEYCKRPVGMCNHQGVCTARPALENCATSGAKVCACTGETLANECAAAAAGISVFQEGACASQ